MSMQAVGDFLTKLDEDAELMSLLKNTLEGAEDQTAWITEVAKKEGFDFTVEEYIQTVDAICEQQEGKLNDSELDGLAGGGGVAPPPPSPPAPNIRMQNLRLRKGGFFDFHR